MSSLVVITPAAPIVTPQDIAGDHDQDDGMVAAMIAAVTESIDGPTGWLGRALGPQTLELAMECWPSCWSRLPCAPVIEIDSIVYLDSNGAEQTVDEADYVNRNGILVFREGWQTPSLKRDPEAVRIRYEAGYDGEDVASGGAGPVPERARQAIILSVQHMLSFGSANLYLRAEEVEGIGRKEYTLSEAASRIVEHACDSLLSTLRVFW